MSTNVGSIQPPALFLVFGRSWHVSDQLSAGSVPIAGQRGHSSAVLGLLVTSDLNRDDDANSLCHASCD